MASKFKYEWQEHKFRSGAAEYKYMCPLMRGEHRPSVYVSAERSAQGIAEQAIYATGISGYTRQFHDLDEAMAYCADVPMRVGGFIRE